MRSSVDTTGNSTSQDATDPNGAAAPGVPAAQPQLVKAGHLAPWEVSTLDAPPVFNWRKLTALIGPGILLAGSSIGAGEWLFGPAVTAQFGGTFLWLATISIVTQTFYNLEVMRYTLYTGEPIFAGFFRLSPGPKFWTAVYLLLCVAHIWPFMASNAAVPVTSMILGHLPGGAMHRIGSFEYSESAMVKAIGYVIFILAFLPLIFGGKIYNVLERMMTFKLIIVLGFLVSVTGFLTSRHNVWEVVSGFFRFGQAAVRADTVIAGPHFNYSQHDGTMTYAISGTTKIEPSGKETTQLAAFTVKSEDGKATKYGVGAAIPDDLAPVRQRLIDAVQPLVKPGRFLVETDGEKKHYHLDGAIESDGQWKLEDCFISSPAGTKEFKPGELPADDAKLVDNIVSNQGFERVGIISYTREHGKLPPLDFPLLAAFAAIAGAGMLSNALFSNYARDKGWGMGGKTGAIPSAIGGHQFALSHVGKVFIVDAESKSRWRGWFRHILRDQTIWMFCSVVGLALPCMLSLEFIRNAPVSGDQAAALTANGLSMRFPAFHTFWWIGTLFVGFMVLAPNAVFAGDLIARLWTDLIWLGSKKAREKPAQSVTLVYYSILAIYGVWGLIALAIFDPLTIAKVGAILGNIALGFSAFHTLWVNRTLLPKPLRPNLFMQAGMVACGIFFLAITVITAWYTFVKA